MLVIGIAGGSGSGKSTFVECLKSELSEKEVAVLSQDAYYRDNSHLSLEERRNQNYDHPNAIEWELLVEHIRALKAGQTVQQPTYSMITCTRGESTLTLKPAPILLVEGILIYTHAMLRDVLDIRVFLEVTEEERYKRVVERDVNSRGRSEAEVANRYAATVQPMYESTIHPSRLHAHLLISGGGLNLDAARFLARLLHHRSV